MPEIIIGSAQDLAKLEGWQIKRASHDPTLNAIRLVLTHVAAEKAMVLVVFPGVSLTLTNLTVVANPLLHFRVEDVPG